MFVQRNMDFLLIIMLNLATYFMLQDQDDDAMLLGAQFCSDCFSCISADAAINGISYSLYARLITRFYCTSIRNYGQ